MAREVKSDFWNPNGDNTLFGDYGTIDYEIHGFDGNDKLYGNNGDDLLLGGDGNDTLFGGNGDDTMKGGDGNDTFYIDRGNDTYVGGTGSDTLTFDNVFILTSLGIGGFVIGKSVKVSDFTIGFNFDAQSGTTFAQTLSSTDYTDNWGTKTLSEGINAIDMTERNDILRDSDLGRRLYGNGGDDIIEGRGGADLISGGAGSDTASYESSGSTVFGIGVQVNLATNTAAFNDAIGDTLSSIENLIGSAHTDFLTGNAQTNVIDGADGNDYIVGGGGRDVLTGGLGRDVFDYNSIAESGTSAPDDIMDFEINIDRIDLASIDARPDVVVNGLPSPPGDQAFTFIGSNNFSGRIGELRVANIVVDGEGIAVVSADINGDRFSDFTIEVHQANGFAPILSANDFIL